MHVQFAANVDGQDVCNIYMYTQPHAWVSGSQSFKRWGGSEKYIQLTMFLRRALDKVPI